MPQPHSAHNLSLAFREVSAATSAAVQECVKCGKSLSMFEYYIYSIISGQAAAHGAHAKLSGGHTVLLNVSVQLTHTTSRPLFNFRLFERYALSLSHKSKTQKKQVLAVNTHRYADMSVYLVRSD